MYVMIRKMGTQNVITETTELKSTFKRFTIQELEETGSWNSCYKRTQCLQDPACQQKAQNSRKKASSSFLSSSHTGAPNCKGVREMYSSFLVSVTQQKKVGIQDACQLTIFKLTWIVPFRRSQVEERTPGSMQIERNQEPESVCDSQNINHMRSETLVVLN